jgi:hypothetical protein
MEKKIKDLILVTAFCPTKEKEDTLKRLVYFLNRYTDLYDIMIVSHSNIDSSIIGMSDYFVYDKENLLLTEDEYRPKMWFNTDGFKIQSNYVAKYSTYYTVLKMTSMGLSLSKSLGYKKVHKIEYDTHITSIIEITENSNLLDNNDVIFYTNNGLKNEMMKGSFWSASIDKLPNLYFNTEKNNLMDLITINNGNTLESYVQKKFMELNYINKKFSTLKNKGFNSGIFNLKDREYGSNFWAIPIYDEKNNEIKFFISNSYQGSVEVIIQYANKIKNVILEKKNLWTLIPLDKIKDISMLNVWLNNNKILSLDFNKIDIDSFKKYNNINYK